MAVHKYSKIIKNSVKNILVQTGFRARDCIGEADRDLDLDTDADLITDFGTLLDSVPVESYPGWSPPRRIVVTEASTRRLNWLRGAAPESELVSVADPDDRRIDTADVIIGWCTHNMVERSRNLKWVQLNSAGFEWRERNEALFDRGILLTNLSTISSGVIAEHGVSMLLALSRGLNHYLKAQKRRLWSPFEAPLENMTQLTGKKALVVGLGSIGFRIAEILNAFGMEVSGVRNNDKFSPDFLVSVGGQNDLEDLLGSADAVINVLPLTEQTHGIFSRVMFAAMKPTAIFINIGRGGTVNTDDLVAALKSGQLRGAGLDVTDPEPLPPKHVLWRMENVIITPHVASRDILSRRREWLLIKENLRRFVGGETMLCVVNTERGY